MTISSAANPLVKDVRRALQRGGLTPQGWCVAETFHLLEEALRDARVRQVLAAEPVGATVDELLRPHPEIPLALLPDRLFQTVSATETSQGVVALVEPRQWSLDDLFRNPALVVVLDGLQDPGNAAEAFGATGVLFLKGAVSPYNPKTLRASAGSLFRVPFVHGVEPDALRQRCTTLYATVPARPGSTARPLSDVDMARGCALIVGSEARGVSPALRQASTEISIPTAGVESLNAAVAAGILLYEASRQRSARA